SHPGYRPPPVGIGRLAVLFAPVNQPASLSRTRSGAQSRFPAQSRCLIALAARSCNQHIGLVTPATPRLSLLSAQDKREPDPGLAALTTSHQQQCDEALAARHARPGPKRKGAPVSVDQRLTRSSVGLPR